MSEEKDWTVHALWRGVPVCEYRPDLKPGEWPEGHRWLPMDGDITHVNCSLCLPRIAKCLGCKGGAIITSGMAVDALAAMGYDVSIKRPSPAALAKRLKKVADKVTEELERKGYLKKPKKKR